MVNPTPGYGITTAYRKTGPYWSLGFHTGADLAGGQGGTPIVSATPGRVISTGYDSSYGYRVIIRWGGYDIWYCHMPKGAALVKVGQSVQAGQRIGTIGSTGNVTGPHLHLEMRVAGGGFAAANFRNPQTAIDYVEMREQVAVTASQLNVREAPTTGSKITRVLDKDFVFEVVSRKIADGIEWIETTQGNYVAADYTRLVTGKKSEPASAPVPDGRVVEVTAAKLNVRESPSTSAEIVRVLEEGFEFTAVARLAAEDIPWIETTKGNYVAADYTAVVKAEPTPPKPAPKPTPAPPADNKLRPPNTGTPTKLPSPFSKMYHASVYAAGNSIIGLETAAAKKYPSIDQDSHITKDGVWVLGHDTSPSDDNFTITAAIKAKYGSKPSIEKMTWADLKTLETPDMTWQGKTVRFRYHQVEAVIAWLSAHPSMSVAFEMKQSKQFEKAETFAELAALCDKYKVDRKRIAVMSIARSYNHLARFKAAHGYFKTVILPHGLKKPSNWSAVEPYVDHYRGSWGK